MRQSFFICAAAEQEREVPLDSRQAVFIRSRPSSARLLFFCFQLGGLTLKYTIFYGFEKIILDQFFGFVR